jgi:hypothetical protein
MKRERESLITHWVMVDGGAATTTEEPVTRARY